MLIFDLIDDTTPDRRPTPNYRGPSEAELREQEEKFANFFHQITSGNGVDNAGPYKLRCIVEGESWWVATKENGSVEMLNVRKGELNRLIAGVNNDGVRNVREGQGGQFVQVYDEKPNTRAIQVNGRTLARQLPDAVTGLAIKGVWSIYEDNSVLELGREFFPVLRSLADAVDLEGALLAEGAVDAAFLRKGKWQVATYKGHIPKKFAMTGAYCAVAATHEDNLYVSDDEYVVETLSTEELFRRVLDDPEFDGLEIEKCRSNGKEVNGILLSPHFLHRALTEENCEFRVKEFVVRNREEFELWLKLVRFPQDYEILEQKDSAGQMTLRAKSRTPTEEWLLQETGEKNDSAVVETREFVVASSSPDAGFGSGASRVLCPGALARELYVYPPKGNPDSQHNWKPGKSMLVGRVLDDKDIAQSRRRIVLANELLKLVPEGSDSIPRTALLTVHGAAFSRSCPFALTRKWIEGTISEAMKYSTKLVLGA